MYFKAERLYFNCNDFILLILLLFTTFLKHTHNPTPEPIDMQDECDNMKEDVKSWYGIGRKTEMIRHIDAVK